MHEEAARHASAQSVVLIGIFQEVDVFQNFVFNGSDTPHVVKKDLGFFLLRGSLFLGLHRRLGESAHGHIVHLSLRPAPGIHGIEFVVVLWIGVSTLDDVKRPQAVHLGVKPAYAHARDAIVVDRHQQLHHDADEQNENKEVNEIGFPRIRRRRNGILDGNEVDRRGIAYALQRPRQLKEREGGAVHDGPGDGATLVHEAQSRFLAQGESDGLLVDSKVCVYRASHSCVELFVLLFLRAGSALHGGTRSFMRPDLL